MSAPETTPAAYTDADVRRVMDALGCYSELDDATQARYCPEHNCGWLSDIDACARAERTLDAVAPAIAARALREFATHIQFAEWPMPPDIGHVAMEAHARADEIEAGR